MPKKWGPMDIYRLLPRENCGDCGIKTCMGFATKLVEREAEVEDCPPLLKPKHESEREKLIDLLTPPVRPVTVGEGERAFRLGGEEVIYRHERTWYNPTVVIIDVHDEMDEKEIAKRSEWITSYGVTKIGEELSFDGIAVRSKSGESKAFKRAVELVSQKTDYPLVLCSSDPRNLRSGLEALEGEKPLLYAATKDTWQEVTDLAIDEGCPLTIRSSDLDELVEISTRALARGLKNDQIALDPGTDPTDLKSTLDRIVKIRRASIEDEFEPLRFPILGVPMTAWMVEKEENEAAFMEATISCALIGSCVDGLILHSSKAWSLMPALVLKQNLYQDPRKPASVEPKLREVGNPVEHSPILITSNFALTYYTVEGDCERVDCYIYPIDTDGTSVASSIAGELLTAEKVVEVVEKEKFEETVSHRTLVIPGKAAVLSGQIEADSGWNVLVGPEDSSGIQAFLTENWLPKE